MADDIVLGQGVNIQSLRRQIAAFDRIKPGPDGKFKYAGKTFTASEWKNYQKPFRNTLAQLEGTTSQQEKKDKAAPVVPPAEQAVPVDWEAAAKEQYGGYYAIVESVPELKTLLLSAVEKGWSDSKFDYELKQTNWWKSTTDSARKWDLGKQSDPATAQQQIDTRAATIREKGLEMGVRFDDAALGRLAEASLRGAWSEELLQSAIGAEAVKTTAGVSGLRQGFVGQTLKQTASNYGVTLSDQTFNNWVEKIALGQETQESFQNYALQTAKTLYPGIAAQLDSGRTFQDVTDPFRQTAARILEINPETVDFSDPKWAKAITFTTDKGEQRPMNYNEWGDYLRQTRSFGYEFTSDARSRAYEVANQLANMFGKV